VYGGAAQVQQIGGETAQPLGLVYDVLEVSLPRILVPGHTIGQRLGEPFLAMESNISRQCSSHAVEASHFGIR